MSRATEKANPAVLMVLSWQKIKNVDLKRHHPVKFISLCYFKILKVGQNALIFKLRRFDVKIKIVTSHICDLKWHIHPKIAK